jgi:hypothetical protein
MQAPHKPLSRRDYTLLSLAWRISVVTKTESFIEYQFLLQIYREVTSINHEGKLLYLQQQGFLKIVGYMVMLTDLSDYNTSMLNGIGVQQTIPTARVVAENWAKHRQTLLSIYKAEPKPTSKPEAKQQTKPSSKKRKRTKSVIKIDLTVLDKINIDQVLTDFAAAISIRKQKSIPAYMALWVIKRFCKDDQNPSQILLALKAKKLVAKRLNSDQQVYWYLIKQGTDLLADSSCSPSLTEQEEERITAGSVHV